MSLLVGNGMKQAEERLAVPARVDRRATAYVQRLRDADEQSLFLVEPADLLLQEVEQVRLYRQPVIRETPRPPVFRSNGFAFHAANYSGNRVESQDK